MKTMSLFKFFSNNKIIEIKVGQKIYSKFNNSVCTVKRVVLLNHIKHYEICVETDSTKREIIISEYAIKSNYKI